MPGDTSDAVFFAEDICGAGSTFCFSLMVKKPYDVATLRPNQMHAAKFIIENIIQCFFQILSVKIKTREL
jgi:hypothetical protein